MDKTGDPMRGLKTLIEGSDESEPNMALPWIHAIGLP